MKFSFFTVAAINPESGQAQLNEFCGQHKLVSVEKQFVSLGETSFWSVCVTYLDGTEKYTPSGKRDRVDYKEILNEQQFAVYAELRNLRKALADQEGVPIYALFTNEQLAEMVTRQIRTLKALGEIEGVGKARLEKYGQAFLTLLNNDETH